MVGDKSSVNSMMKTGATVEFVASFRKSVKTCVSFVAGNSTYVSSSDFIGHRNAV